MSAATSPAGVDRQSTVWYSFTPAEDVLVLADVAGTDFDVVVGVWTGEPFDLVLTACSRFLESTVAFPAVDRIRSYPTTIFLDATGQPRAIHTGFSGPATGEAHKKLRRRFEGILDGMASGR